MVSTVESPVLQEALSEIMNSMVGVIAHGIIAMALNARLKEIRHIPQSLTYHPVWLLSPKGKEMGQFGMAQAQRIVRKQHCGWGWSLKPPVTRKHNDKGQAIYKASELNGR